MQIEKKSDQVIKISKPGWKAMPYILGLEATEMLTSYIMTEILTVYLIQEFHVDKVKALNIINIWNFACNIFSIFGAIAADVYIGKFLTIAMGSFTYLLGMVTIILTASLPQLRPPLCATKERKLHQCISPTQIQKAVLLIGLFLMSIGAGGIRPCCIPFGKDQFDTNTPQGKKELNNYYNWFLNKAALVEENSNEVKPDGTCANQWRLCSIQQVEEVKHMVKVIPIWASGFICMVAIQQKLTFTMSQAFKMDKHIGTHQIHPGWMDFISLITIAIWIPIYDCLLQPAFQKLSKIEEGITSLQRIGLGYISSVTCMVVAGLVERKRRALAILGVEPLSIIWLAPQLIFAGLCEVLAIVGHVELYNREFPERMRSIGTCMVLLCNSAGSYLSNLIVNIVHHVTSKNGQPDWLTNDINFGRLDYFYFLIGGIGVLNFIYFVVCSIGYHYKKV